MKNRHFFQPPQASERFQRISEKLGSASTNQDASKSRKIEQICKRVTDIEEKIQDQMNQHNRIISSLKEELNKVVKQIDLENLAFEQSFMSQSHQINSLEERIFEKLETEIQTRELSQQRMQTYLNDQITQLYSDLYHQQKIRQEETEELNSAFKHEMPKLHALVQKEKSYRENADLITLRKSVGEIKKLNDGVDQQIKLREDCQRSIYEMLTDLVSRVRIEVNEIRKEREEAQDSFLSLLDQATNKIHHAYKE